jgi:hypothetical protein
LGETRTGLPDSTAAGQPVPGLVLDLDASIVICHSEKESATATYMKSAVRFFDLADLTFPVPC